MRWLVWDIRPEDVHGRATSGARRADYSRQGWLVFVAGNEKRRLTPIPRDWDAMTDAELATLLDPAEIVPSRLSAASEPGEGFETDALTIVRFRYPGGSAWTVYLHRTANDAPGGSKTVLRFSWGGRTVDLDRWPPGWANLPEEELIALLRSVARRATSPSTHPTRRWNDLES